ncbi:hypothetical protein [Streptomyces sp. NPDC005435]|uniref:hypothetical protein n=1 Tax=Streptomyces sp. NPDC005435 TaxID=3154464 RepID=UPI003456B770
MNVGTCLTSPRPLGAENFSGHIFISSLTCVNSTDWLVRTSPYAALEADIWGTAPGGEGHRAEIPRGTHVSVLLPVLESVLKDAATVSAATGLTYAGAVVMVAASSVLFRSPQRRRDARATLTILMRRREKR